jgi:hypothetical protein
MFSSLVAASHYKTLFAEFDGFSGVRPGVPAMASSIGASILFETTVGHFTVDLFTESQTTAFPSLSHIN